MRQSLKEFLEDPRRKALEKLAEERGVADGDPIPVDLWRECGYSEVELRRLGLVHD